MFYSLKKQCITVSTKILHSRTSVLNIDDNRQCYLSISENHYFWRNCQFCTSRKKLHFKMNSNRKQLFKTGIIFHNITVLLFFWSNKCHLGQRKILFKNINKPLSIQSLTVVLIYKIQSDLSVIYWYGHWCVSDAVSTYWWNI